MHCCRKFSQVILVFAAMAAVLVWPMARTVLAQYAGEPPIVNGYQGVLELSGVPAPDGTYSMEFRLFDAPVGGTELWMETQMVSVSDAHFNVFLGSETPFPDIWWIDGQDPDWLQLTVNGETLMPRTPLASVPAAFAARSVRGDIKTTPGNIVLETPECPDDTCIQSGISAVGGTGTLFLRNGGAAREEVSLVVETEIVELNFTYDGLDRLVVGVDANQSDLSLVTYDGVGDTGSAIVNMVGNGDASQHVHVYTPSGSMNSIALDLDQTKAETRYVYDALNRLTISANAAKTSMAMTDIGSSGQDGIRLDVDDAFGSTLRVAEIGSSGLDGVRLEDKPVGPSIILDGGGQRIRSDVTATEVSTTYTYDERDLVFISGDASKSMIHLSDIGSSGLDGVKLEADTGSSAVTVGLTGAEDGWILDLNAENDHGVLRIWRMDTDILQLRGSALATTQTLYHRIPNGDSISGISQTADANGARLMVSEYGVGGTDGITMSTGSTGSFISVSGVGSGGVPGLVLRDDRLKLGNMSTAVPNTVAMGNRAKANHAGSMVLADMSAMDLMTSLPDQLLARFASGVTIYTNATQTAGVSLLGGGSDWQVISDRSAKRNIRPVDGQEILDRLAAIPISRWSYKAQAESIEHIGPMAQDFHAAFGLGGDETKISTLDPSGVALAAIQELHRRTEQLSTQTAEIERLNQRITELERLIGELAIRK